jgi:hypothetical protein
MFPAAGHVPRDASDLFGKAQDLLYPEELKGFEPK